MMNGALKLSIAVKNMIQYPSEQIHEGGELMGMSSNLILTGWGYLDYVVAAAAAYKAFNGDADILGVSKRRLPELLDEIADRKKRDTWSSICILGVSLSGDLEMLASALAKLKSKGVGVTWISSIDMDQLHRHAGSDCRKT